MMTRILLARRATVAIAASVAVPVMPALAQDAAVADPVIVLPPQTAPSAAPVPQIVLPEPISSEPMAAAPVAAPAPETTMATTAQTPAAVSARPATSTSRTSAPASVPESSVRSDVPPAAVAQANAPVATANPVQTASAPVAIEQEPVVPPSATIGNSGTNELALAGVLGAFGLVAFGGIAFAASRRRRDRVETEVGYEPLAIQPAAEPALDAPVAVEPQPVVQPQSYTAPVSVAPAMARTRTYGDPVALPEALPETFEERDALLHELVAAKPDRANPFTAPRARARRAKLIMQSLGQTFRDRKPRIDLSEYTNRWPALRGWQPATA